MILADKIIALRKKNGWSQDELAEKLGISRQSVSKWESAQSIPDINRILELSRIFGVTTDYLLKEDQEEEILMDTEDERLPQISLSDATRFLDAAKQYSHRMGIGAMLCVLSPVLLILLCGAAEERRIPFSENRAAAVGLCALLILITAAVILFVLSNIQMEQYKPRAARRGRHATVWDSNAFELAYGVSGILREQNQSFRNRYPFQMAAGAALCILSSIPLLLGGALGAEDFILISETALLLVIIAFACYLLVSASLYRDSLDRLLQEGNFRPENREKAQREERLGSIYWPVVTAIYLGWSFWTMDWHITWIIWPVAGCLYSGISAAFHALRDRHH